MKKELIAPVPAIGAYWEGQGGCYAGQRRLPDGTWVNLIYAKEVVGKAQWGSYGKEIKGADCFSDGLKNTTALVKAKSPAALMAREFTADGHDDFFLLSQQDAQLLAANRLLPADTVLWTSTQFSARTAWAQTFSHGDTLINYKDDSFSVLPVRRLKI